MRTHTAFLTAAFALSLAACAASPVPDPIREAAPNQVTVAEAQAQPEQFKGAVVRWGGSILSTENREDETWITVLARPLGNNGRPNEEAAPWGRFIAVLSGFHEPAVYKEDRELTVRGTLTDSVTRAVGEFPYRYPVLRASTHYLWPPRQPARAPYYYDPFWYDPWYGPYPFYPRYYGHPYW